MSDFFLLRKKFCPLLIGEVVSEKDESDKIRMLLQCATIARLGTALTNPDYQFVVQAVYLNSDLSAERYLACADPSVRASHVRLILAETTVGSCPWSSSSHHFL